VLLKVFGRTAITGFDPKLTVEVRLDTIREALP
jgi:hypothetical protein